ncbi:MAG: hypothetical protein ACK4MF_02265 [Hyphomicrobiaceae bacterium]
MTSTMESVRAARLNKLLALSAEYREATPTQRRGAVLAYLFEVAELLTVEAGDDQIIAPLLDVLPYIADPTESPLFQERRQVISAPSDSVLARAAATIDVLVTTGLLPDAAAQVVARQMVGARAGLPAEGGDARGWKRLALWRERLQALKKPAGAWRAYTEFTKSIESMDRPELLRRANDGSLWDIRRQRAEALKR